MFAPCLPPSTTHCLSSSASVSECRTSCGAIVSRLRRPLETLAVIGRRVGKGKGNHSPVYTFPDIYLDDSDSEEISNVLTGLRIWLSRTLSVEPPLRPDTRVLHTLRGPSTRNV